MLRSGLAILVLLGSFAPALADTGSKEPTVDSSEAVHRWVKERVKRAGHGKPELVRLPIVGCMASATCPSWWAIGFAEDMEEDQEHRWILPIGDGVTLPAFGRAHGVAAWAPVLVVEGFFTGVMRMPTDEEGFPEATEEKLAELKVLRFTRASRRKADRALRIVATGEEARKKVDRLADDRAWLVLTASLPLFEPGSKKAAAKLKEKLVAAGFRDAEVFDSRRARNLFCCYLVVVAGRYRTQDEAQEVVKQVKAKGFDVYAKQGW